MFLDRILELKSNSFSGGPIVNVLHHALQRPSNDRGDITSHTGQLGLLCIIWIM